MNENEAMAGKIVSILKEMELKFKFPRVSFAQIVTLWFPSLQTTEVMFPHDARVVFVV